MASRKLYVDGKCVFFSNKKFNSAVKEYQARCATEGKKLSLDSIWGLIADNIPNISVEGVRNWYRGKNGVSSIATIKSIANTLNIDFREIISDADEEPILYNGFPKPSVTCDENDIILQMYELFVEFVYLFIGYDCEAYHIYETPYIKMEEYITNLYHFLDGAALDIGTETFYKLRRTITELHYMAGCTRPGVNIPEEWKRINPFLDTEGFVILYEYYYEKEDYWWDEIYFEEYDNLQSELHMYLEDMPELVKRAEAAQKAKGDKDNHFIKTLIQNERFDASLKPSELVARELANTLLKLMKSRFQQFQK